MASGLFSPITLRGLTLPNRVVVSPMCQYNSDNGSANDWHLMHHGAFSLGAAGLVMTEMTDVNPRGRSPSFAAHLARLYSRHVRRYWQTVRVTGANSRNREGCT